MHVNAWHVVFKGGVMTNNDKLKQLMTDNGLTAITVSKLLSCSESSVNSWRQSPSGSGARVMPTAKLRLLEILIKNKGVKK